jgi:hypothetical protein
MSLSINELKNLIQAKFEDMLLSPLHCSGSSTAIFIAKTNGKTVVGWHYAPTNTKAGAKFHYDHGAGINRNTDGTYIWITPASMLNPKLVLLDYNNLAHKFSNLL